MRAGDFLRESEAGLGAAGVGTARLDALILLEDELGRDRAWLLAHPETPLQGSTLQKLKRRLARRIKHEPLAYIRGKTEFYGREFFVNRHVLEPRPESETMIDLLKNLLHHKNRPCKVEPCKLVDVGTGSGALAITAKLEMLKVEVVATDIDPKCLKVARQNARKHGVKIKLLQGNLLTPTLLTNYQLLTSIVLANLPYVPDGFHVNQAAAMEPRLAIFGGPDGLDLYRRLFGQLARLETKPKNPLISSFKGRTLKGVVRPVYVLTEAMPPQHKKLARIAKAAGYKPKTSEDFIQLFELRP